MSRERRLGRGLEALLGRGSETPRPADDEQVDDARPVEPTIQADTSESGQSAVGRQTIATDAIDANPYQPRRQFDEAEIEALADSLRSHGLLQPLVVRASAGRFQLIAGERRLRAARLAGWSEVPAEVRDVDDRQMAELAIVETVQRKDLNPLEKAASFQRYLSEYGCTQEELASRVSIDRSTVANLIRLLELPEEVKAFVASGELSQGHGRALLPLGDETEQVQFAQRIVREELSVRATEAAVKQHIQEDDAQPLTFSMKDAVKNAARTRQANLASLEDELRTALGTKVEIKQSAKGRGRITVHFANADEFERLRRQLVTHERRDRQVA